MLSVNKGALGFNQTAANLVLLQGWVRSVDWLCFRKMNVMVFANSQLMKWEASCVEDRR